jgi:ribosomal protein S18 acetylase RimI-like enzyme
MNVEYKIGLASQIQINKLLLDCDNFFIPKLSEKVNIDEYSMKIFENSIVFEAYYGDNLIGIIAMYENSFGYITNVSVANEHAGKGIASCLLKNCIEYAKGKNLDKINLEVNKRNIPALKLYSKYKFEVYEQNDSSKFMQLELKP